MQMVEEGNQTERQHTIVTLSNEPIPKEVIEGAKYAAEAARRAAVISIRDQLMSDYESKAERIAAEVIEDVYENTRRGFLVAKGYNPDPPK